jgi:enoyl-CoA hydratase
MDKPVLFEVEDGIALVTLNRPERRNAMNQELLIHLYRDLDEVNGNDAIRVAILTGNGNSFCSGIDLKSVLTENLADPLGDGREFPDVVRACRKPLIGAVNGHTITGGLEIALNLDFLIASERATFMDTHARVGIHPAWGMTQLLQQAVGQRMARQMSFSCQPITAERALQCGLVNEVVPHEELLPRARQVARDICAANPDVLASIRQVIDYRNRATLHEALAEERRSFQEYARVHLAARG